MKCFPLRCASTIQILCRSRSIADTQPNLQPAFLRLSAMTSEYFTQVQIDRTYNGKSRRKDFTRARGHSINAPMNVRPRCILFVAPVALASVSWMPQVATATDFDQARVTQIIQDVKVLPSGAAARQAAVNETVNKGSAVQTGVKSRSEMTFKHHAITR